MGKLMLNDINYSGGGGGSNVSITPTLSTGTKIADFEIDGVSDSLYAPSGSGGSSVIPNPQGTPTDTLNTIEIDNTIYDIAGSGGGGTGQTIADVLWSGPETPSTTGTDITLSHAISDYDFIVFTVNQNSAYDSIVIIAVNELTIGERYIKTGYSGSQMDVYFDYTSDTTINIKSSASAYLTTYIKITGLKFCGTLAPQIFSTEEKEIGVWIDNKPLYQKTYDLNNMTVPDNTWTNNLLNTTGTGINITHYEGIFGLGSVNYEFSNFSYYRNSDEFFTAMIATDNDDINVRPNMNAGTPVTINRVTIQYTKNSDTPGSGSYGTLGIPMVTYNGDEKVIGTWFGETLYEKSYIIDNLAPNPSDWVNDIQITGIKDIAEIVCSGYLSSGTVSFVAPYITVSYNHTSGYTRHYFRDLGSSGQVTLRTTIRYTKTT